MKAPECQSFTQKKKREEASGHSLFFLENIYFMTNLYKMDQKINSLPFNYIIHTFFHARCWKNFG